MPRPDDFAILVGIQEYPGAGFLPLSGPVNDVEYFRRWLIDPNGGDVHPDNVAMLLTQKPAPAAPADEFPPTRHEIEKAIRKIVLNGNGVIRRPEGRLYLYFSGHGFSDFGEKTLHAALYAANAQPGDASSICGTKYANWCQRAAVFGEIVLVMDCCRDEEVSKQVLPPPFDDIHDPALSKQVRLLEIYAVPYGGKAQERFFNDVQNHHGLLTYALVAALYGAPLEKVKLLGKDPVRSSHALKEFMEGCWPDVAGENGPEPPEFVLPRRGDMMFSKQPPRTLPRSVIFAPPIAGTATLRIIDNDNAETVKVDLDTAAATATFLFKGAAAPLVHNFDGTKVDLNLRPEIYEVILEQPGAAPRDAVMPMVGDRDVSL